MYTILYNKATMKQQSNCDKRYMCTFTPTAIHIRMHAHGDQTSLDATSKEADLGTKDTK